MTILLLLTLAFSDQKAVFTVVKKYESVDLVRPRYYDFDAEDQLHILDTNLKEIHFWSKDGAYLGHFGKSGQGPGELALENQVGGMKIFKGRLYVFDESTSKVHIFNAKTHEFEKSIACDPKIRRLYLDKTKDAFFAVNVSSAGETQQVVKLNADFEIVETLYRRPFLRFEHLKDRKFIYRPYAAVFVLSCDEKTMVLAESDQNYLKLHDSQGKLIRTIRFPMAAEDLTEADKNYHKERVRTHGYPSRTVLEWPDKGHALNRVVILGDKFLIMKDEDGTDRFKGLVYNRQFEKLGTFSQTFEGMYLFGQNGNHLLSIATNKEDDYQIMEYRITLEGQK